MHLYKCNIMQTYIKDMFLNNTHDLHQPSFEAPRQSSPCTALSCSHSQFFPHILTKCVILLLFRDWKMHQKANDTDPTPRDLHAGGSGQHLRALPGRTATCNRSRNNTMQLVTRSVFCPDHLSAFPTASRWCSQDHFFKDHPTYPIWDD